MTAARRIKPTSTFRRSARRPNPGRGSTYPRGDAVQTTGTSSVADYKASKEYKKLAKSTRAQWGKWLDRIADYFGELRIAQFDRTEKIRPVIRRWRNQWADTPRTADYALQVLSRAVAHGVELGSIAGNPCEGIKHLYSNDRSEIIWTDADVAQIKKTCSSEIADAVELASQRACG